ncbi:alpha/beta fold hydrolase [Paenibacillus sp. IHBB 3054]|uniref:alpha/beta fold hydrolase n=1 Tax=Paenibacillus sp. IHBB 3054 TaxID=3425689 RepID=UPI003F66B9E2
MLTAKLHDGSEIEVVITGEGPNLLLPVNPYPVIGPQAAEMLKWGADPALGRSLIDALSGKYRVIAFDYEGHVQSKPKPDTLTPANVTKDFLSIADAAQAPKFAYYGYSWLALSGLQLALHTDRITALVMGGFPPIGGPYKEMLRVTMATHELSQASHQYPSPTPDSQSETWNDFDWSTVEVTLTEAQTRQFVTLYEALQPFDDRAAQTALSCPRMCFAGAADTIDYDERWGGVRVDIAGPFLRQREELEALGWKVSALPELDHTGAMQASHVLPILIPWLNSKLL